MAISSGFAGKETREPSCPATLPKGPGSLPREARRAATQEGFAVLVFFFTIVIVLAYATGLGELFLTNTGLVEGLPELSASILALLAISHAGYLGYKGVPHSAAATSSPQVPNVLGRDVRLAEQAVQSAGLSAASERRQSQEPAGQVVETRPVVDTPLPPLGEVTLIYSGTRVPNVVGQDLAPAEQAVQNADLTAASRGTQSNAPLGRVVQTDPAAGTPLPPQDEVTLIYSGTRVPNVVGQDLAPAEQAVQNAGLSVNSEEVASQEPAGRVVQTDPAAGMLLARGADVTLHYSSGP